ncbi:MBOAT family O-acyltransferase [Cyclobacterium plantarum]|uniref:MBOAT family protein n=1 Tax=Cyclobacterium plantarum TaxID=2716263 RepID=A0ABX0HE35_9BACT|nr:MBOAT family O-acyltransferase [Cyclobacterium plantarum]NHE58593.1 MBOAT family protein [Cyclobacterium plantarum]
MLFNSIDFAVFLPTVFLLYWLVKDQNLKLQNFLIVAASYLFYGWWDWRFLSLILFSTIVDYLVGLGLLIQNNKTKRKILLWTSILVNLGFLAFFKYYNFFLDNFITAFSFFGKEIKASSLNIILPVGISFYTFQTLSYSIDVYKRKLEPTKDFLAFSAFVSFFPQLVAGPIERAKNLLPQFYVKRTFTYQLFSEGVKLMIVGFFMKLVVADRAAIYVNAVYNNVDNHAGLSFMAATILFAFQIYGDFAGYSLIAIGTARLFGFKLMTNFNRPYFATSVGDFWKRWHISLSTWFRDYLYIPLGGNQVIYPRWLINIFITFLVSGFWHGANWTFIIWGSLNGIYLIIEAVLFKSNNKKIINVLLTFILICFSWIFFRANNVNDALYIVKSIIINPGKLYIPSDNDVIAPVFAVMAISILLGTEIKKEYFNKSFSLAENKYPLVRWGFYSCILFLILYMGVFNSSQFIYFQF